MLHIVWNLNYGGLERVLADLVRGIDEERFETHILSLGAYGHFAKGLENAARLHGAEPMSRFSMLWPGSLIRQVRRIAPDVVHTHSGVWYKASLAARIAGVARVIHTEHGRQLPDPWQARLVDGLASRWTDAVVAVSSAARDQLAQQVVHQQDRLCVILNGIDTAKFLPAADNKRLRRELKIPAQTAIIGSIGRLEWIKGYDVMIEAFALLVRQWRGAYPPSLVLAGDGSERKALEQRVHRLGIERHVHLLGWRNDIQDLHSAFTVFSLSSRSEGTSMSLLEAMCAGICPVVTDVGGNAAILGAELRHCLVAPDDPAALASAWKAALQRTSERGLDGQVAAARVRATFGLAEMVRQYECLYLQRCWKDA